MDTNNKRPAIIWVPQILLVLLSILFTYSFLSDVWMLAKYIGTNESDADEFRKVILGYSIVLTIFFTFLMLFLSSIFGMLKRKRWARWLALSVLIFFWSLLIAEFVFRPVSWLSYYELQNKSEIIAGKIIELFIHGMFLFSTIILAFSKRIVAFFNKDKPLSDYSYR